MSGAQAKQDSAVATSIYPDAEECECILNHLLSCWPFFLWSTPSVSCLLVLSFIIFQESCLPSVDCYYFLEGLNNNNKRIKTYACIHLIDPGYKRSNKVL